MEDQRGTVFDLASKSVKFNCLFCKDFSEAKHHIKKIQVLGFLDDTKKEQFTLSYNRFIAEHDVRNKHCPIPDCRYYTSTSIRIDCPEHGRFCTRCFEKIDVNLKPHKCPGVHRELRELNLRRCPSCMSLVEKRGGCDHMKCACGHDFYWNRLKPIGRKKVIKKIKKVKK